MLKKISLRWRLTLMTAVLITVCCVGLTVVLNFSATRLAASIEATAVTTPAQWVEGAQQMEQENPESIPFVPLESSRQAQRGFRAESLVYMGVAVLLGSFFTYYISGRALKPVKVLNGQVKNIHIHNLSETLEVPSTGDEISELTQSFNEMTDKLDEAFLAQRRFSASAAHELRTPLAVLQTKLDVFRKKEQHTPQEYEALVAAFQKQTLRLRSLVTELLDIANMEEGFERQEVPLRELLNDVIAELSPLAKEKGITFSQSGGECSAWGNPDLLYRVFYNLVENAVKYSGPGAGVAVKAGADEQGLTVITVRDTGVGIPDPLKKQIFEPFYRVDKSRSREMGGAGLGLSIVNTILKKHGGTVAVADNPGSGTCFTVTLPPTE